MCPGVVEGPGAMVCYMGIAGVYAQGVGREGRRHEREKECEGKRAHGAPPGDEREERENSEDASGESEAEEQRRALGGRRGRGKGKGGRMGATGQRER